MLVVKIIVSAFSNLTTDQRIEKICKTLSDNGFKVHLIGSTWGDETPVTRNYPTEKIKIVSRTLKTAYPEFNFKLYQRLNTLVTKDTILYCNDLDALLAHHLIAKKKNIPLIYDSHEIFTEMPSVKGRFTQKIWQWVEKSIMPHIRYMIAASGSYADWFVEKYGIVRPTIVRNFPQKNFHFSEIRNSPKILLYQGMLNPSRGLEKILLALPQIENVVLHIAGDGPLRKELEILVHELSLEEKVKFLGKIPPKKLVKITRNADIGLSIEENNGQSYYYSLPNKISDYIQAGVPILTSSFPEMKKIVTQYQVGEVIENHSPEELKSKIEQLLALGKGYYHNHLRIAAEELCWENEEKALLSVIHRVKKENFG